MPTPMRVSASLLGGKGAGPPIDGNGEGVGVVVEDFVSTVSIPGDDSTNVSGAEYVVEKVDGVSDDSVIVGNDVGVVGNVPYVGVVAVVVGDVGVVGNVVVGNVAVVVGDVGVVAVVVGNVAVVTVVDVGVVGNVVVGNVVVGNVVVGNVVVGNVVVGNVVVGNVVVGNVAVVVGYVAAVENVLGVVGNVPAVVPAVVGVAVVVGDEGVVGMIVGVDGGGPGVVWVATVGTTEVIWNNECLETVWAWGC